MEIWKNTQYNNYQVSNYGNVRNTKTVYQLTNSPSKSNNYYKVTLSVYKNGESSSLPIEIHRLVAVAFVPKPISNERLVVDHINDNKLDNRPCNLQWLTVSENLKKAKRNNPRNPKLTQQQIDEMKDLYSNGMSFINITIFMNTKYGRTSPRQTYSRNIQK